MYIFFVSLFVYCADSSAEPISIINSSDNILCRECGTKILSSDTLISKLSTASLYSFNDTIFNRKDVLVQLLEQNIILRYPIITSSESSCLGIGDWNDDELWFPDHVMKPCFCPDCGAFVGWMFENRTVDSPTTVQTTNQFFGLILTSLIGENYLNSLITLPKI